MREGSYEGMEYLGRWDNPLITCVCIATKEPCYITQDTKRKTHHNDKIFDVYSHKNVWVTSNYGSFAIGEDKGGKKRFGIVQELYDKMLVIQGHIRQKRHLREVKETGLTVKS